MKRPVWLFSLDTEQFDSPPMTTGGLLAYFREHGRTREATEVQLVHFRATDDVDRWLRDSWDTLHALRARQAVLRGLWPVVGFSVYTWNAEPFLSAVARLRASCPELLIVAGGPHVQKPERYLREDAIDVVVMGEGELTFTELLDRGERAGWGEIRGLSYLEGGVLVETPARPRVTELDALPTALDVVPLRDEQGRPRYKSVAYETSRGCPFRCAFCEWGTGAIGTKMHQLGLSRIASDFERLIEGGIEDIWLSDSNFGALREDLEKAELIVALRKRTGRPYTLATSWSKSHNARVQAIVLLLKENGLLSHYNLALQTLTPLALKLSNRKNMRSNQYRPIAKAMAEQGVGIATELIWGLPGDTLDEFERNLDELERFFPNINIFGYTLLPGTEFYDRREEYAIETVPVAGYGKAKGEYVIGCHTFDRDEGLEGYFLITAHILLVRGSVMPLSVRYLALLGGTPVSALLRAVLRALAAEFAAEVPGFDVDDRLSAYEHRAALYLAMLRRLPDCFAVIARALRDRLLSPTTGPELWSHLERVLALDHALCPRVGAAHDLELAFDFDAVRVLRELERMELPEAAAFAAPGCALAIHHPAHVGEVLKDPDGGSWMRGQVRAASAVPRVAS